MKEFGKEEATRQDEDVLVLHVTCYRCGKEGQKAADCRYKNAKCHKTGHLANVCRLNSRKVAVKKSSHSKWKANKRGDIQTVGDDDSTEPSSDEQLHGIFQMGGKSPTFMVTVAVNGVPIDMEIDTGAERSTIPTGQVSNSLQGTTITGHPAAV